MELDDIVRRLEALCGLTAAEAEGERDQCAAALARVEGERNSAPGGEEALAGYAAALAAHRFVLRGRDAARALEEDYRRVAAPWLRPAGFCFRRAGGPGVGP